MKSKTTAAIIALFLGGIGGHRFYLGQVGLGIVYLIFFFTFIPAFIALVDLIIFLTMSEDAFNRKYNPGYTGPINPNQSNITVSLGNNSFNNVAEQLYKLSELKDKGLLTDEEFTTQKTKILAA